MKPCLAYCLLLLAGVASGQTAPLVSPKFIDVASGQIIFTPPPGSFTCIFDKANKHVSYSLPKDRLPNCFDLELPFSTRRPPRIDISDPLPPVPCCIISADMTFYGGEPRWPPAQDVPAIQEERDFKTGETCKTHPYCEGKDWSCNLVTCTDVVQKSLVTTCADHSRILLTDESGGKHCIKFHSQ